MSIIRPRPPKRLSRWLGVAAITGICGFNFLNGAPAASAASTAPSVSSSMVAANQSTSPTLTTAVGQSEAAVVTATKTVPKEPQSALGCNKPFYPEAAVCLYVNGSSNYVNYIQFAVELKWPGTVRGYFRIKTMLPAANYINFRTNGTYACHDGWPLLRHCWYPITYYFRVHLALDSINQRVPRQVICALFFNTSGRQIAGNACITISGASGPVGHTPPGPVAHSPPGAVRT